MRRLSWLAALVPALSWTPVSALEIVESVFQVTFTRDGTEYVLNDPAVPLLPENTCYSWYLRATETGTPVRFVERFTLSEAIDWGTTGESPDDVTRLEQAGKVAVTTIDMTTDEQGWFSHGWCVAEGDPAGDHLIEVSVDGDALASFPFQVLAADDYSFPVTHVVTGRTARTVTDSW